MLDVGCWMLKRHTGDGAPDSVGDLCALFRGDEVDAHAGVANAQPDRRELAAEKAPQFSLAVVLVERLFGRAGAGQKTQLPDERLARHGADVTAAGAQ